MTFKILTYADPYSLDKADFWASIKQLPHFGVSRVLVNGFKNLMRDSIEGLICPLDDLVNHQKVYGQWTDSISRRLKQYNWLTKMFENKYNNGEIDEKFYHALKQNQNQFLQALRLFIELDIAADALNRNLGNKEQQLFTDLYSWIRQRNDHLFSFPLTPNRQELKEIVVDLAEKELTAFEKRKPEKESTDRQNEKNWYQRIIEKTKDLDITGIVVHGVHQFSPAQLRLIVDLEKQGLDIFFLFNYQEQFSEIYSTWDYIYGYFDATVHRDRNIPKYEPNLEENFKKGFDLGSAMGHLLQGSLTKNKDLGQRYESYKDCKFIEFGNITEYATYVGNYVDKARKDYERENNNTFTSLNTNRILYFMEEQVYTANKSVHDLLEIYYPDFSKDRHFLSYPIGQFFYAIYRLWNQETGEIDFELSAIKECLGSNLLRAGDGATLLRVAYELQIMLEGIKTYADFRETIENQYLLHYDEVVSCGEGPVSLLKQLSVYNRYKIRKDDIQKLINAVKEINAIAQFLFKNDKNRHYSFGTYLNRVTEFINQHQLDLASEEEQKLITSLLERIEEVITEADDLTGTFEDLKEGLYYFLKQKQERDRADWIVRNFEQIEGDILNSKKQKQMKQKKVYHFACVSDKDLNPPVNKLLPWPLSDNFISKAYAPVDLQFQVYYASLNERGNFLRYALFYGLYYNHCEVKLSFVKQEDKDTTTEPYILLRVLGLKPETSDKGNGDFNASTNASPSIERNSISLSDIKYDLFMFASFFLCPHRYLLEWVLNNEPVAVGNVQYQQFFQNVVIDQIREKLSHIPKGMRPSLDEIIKQESDRIAKYFWFLSNTEIDDLRKRAKNYIYQLLRQEQNSITIDHQHSKLRRYFGKAKFEVDNSENQSCNPFPAFHWLYTQNEQNTKRKYSLPRLKRIELEPETERKMRVDILRYLSLNKDYPDHKMKSVGPWCSYCGKQNVCLEHYLQR